MPERIQLRRTAGWRKPEGAVVVTRLGRFGNPYVVVGPRAATSTEPNEVGTAAEAVEAYRELLRRNPTLVAAVRRELAGKDLCCWCADGQPCHADTLIEIANGGTP